MVSQTTAKLKYFEYKNNKRQMKRLLFIQYSKILIQYCMIYARIGFGRFEKSRAIQKKVYGHNSIADLT